jgi:PiT family inorganic phosphate transporter
MHCGTSLTTAEKNFGTGARAAEYNPERMTPKKTMGIITAVLVAGGIQHDFHVPSWVIAASSAAIGLGTMSGGWRIVRTMGTRLARLPPHRGFYAETGAAISVLFATWLGLPVSSNHAIAGAIAGVGSIQRTRAVRWNVAGGIMTAWVFTIPSAALISAILYFVIHLAIPGV